MRPVVYFNVISEQYNLRNCNQTRIRKIDQSGAGGPGPTHFLGQVRVNIWLVPPTFDFGPLLIDPLTLRNVTTSLLTEGQTDFYVEIVF